MRLESGAVNDGLRGELRGHFGPYFETFRANMGTNGGECPFRASSKFLHFQESSPGNSADCAAPTAMSGTDDSRLRVKEKQRKAVSRVDAEELPGAISYEGVNLIEVLAGDGNIDGMSLAGNEYFPRSGYRGEFGPMVSNLFGVSPGIIADIKTGESAERTDAGFK